MKNNNRTNPVAKFGNRLHRPATHRDKTKYYRKGQLLSFGTLKQKISKHGILATVSSAASP